MRLHVQLSNILLESLIQRFNPLHGLPVLDLLFGIDVFEDLLHQNGIKEALLDHGLNISRLLDEFDKFQKQILVILLDSEHVESLEVTHLAIISKCYVDYFIVVHGLLHNRGFRDADRYFLLGVLEHQIHLMLYQVDDVVV